MTARFLIAWKDFQKADQWMLEHWEEMTVVERQNAMQRFETKIIVPLEEAWQKIDGSLVW